MKNYVCFQLNMILITGSICLFSAFNGAGQVQGTENELIASTFLGGNGYDGFVYDVDQFSFLLHPNGDIYLCGTTESLDFPVSEGAYQESFAGGDSDSFIARMSPDLSVLNASTFIGGTNKDYITDMLISETGDIYICGYTYSSDFPITSNAFDTTFNDTGLGGTDVFVSVLHASLDSLKFSTFLGGSLPDGRHHVRMILDQTGNIVIGGGTMSYDFPLSAGALITNPPSPYNDLFLSVMTPELDALLASTYFGGSAFDQLTDILLDDENNIIFCGMTGSANFPVTKNAYDMSFNGKGDVFVSKVNISLNKLIASTFLGGADFDLARSIAFGSQGYIYIGGRTESTDFPTTPDTYDSIYNGGLNDAYVSCLDDKLESLACSTLLGGFEWDEITDVLYDSVSGGIFVTGFTGHKSFPVSSSAYDPEFNGETDCVICRFNSELSDLSSSTFLGGSSYDFGIELVFSEAGNLLVCGNSASLDFPVTSGVYDDSFNGLYDVFVTEIDKDLTGLPVGIEVTEQPGNTDALACISVSPNPFRETTRISISVDDKFLLQTGIDIQLRLIDPETGNVENILDRRPNDPTYEFNYSPRELQPGYYLLQLNMIKNRISRQIALHEIIKVG